MQLLSQLLSLLWTIWTCGIHILIDLPAVVLRLALRTSRPPLPSAGGEVQFYEGKVTHVRRAPLKNSFCYKVRLALIILDSPPEWFHKHQTLAHHMTAEEARAFAGTTGPVKLLTNPEAAGYVQNPISVYYCYTQSEDAVERCIAEVTNTPWSDMVRFIFRPSGEDVPKSLHVSPFMDMQATWHLSASKPADSLLLSVLAKKHPVLGDCFDAHLMAKWFGYMPQRVACLIYWQAVKLLWKGATFYPPPSKEFRGRFDAKESTSHPLTMQGCPFQWVDVQDAPWRTD